MACARCAERLKPGETYVAVLKDGILDLKNKPLKYDFSWSITTKAGE
jgi:hypothetical protein